MAAILWAVVLLWAPPPRAWARTIDDTLHDMKKGDGSVLLGAFEREVAIIRDGLANEGKVTAMMTRFIGEVIWEMGKAFVDFPIAPAVHLSVFRGGATGVEAAFYLIVKGANVSAYFVEPNGTATNWAFSYPPALLFALGFGQPLRDSHAVVIDRLQKSLQNNVPGALFSSYTFVPQPLPSASLSLSLSCVSSSIACARRGRFSVGRGGRVRPRGGQSPRYTTRGRLPSPAITLPSHARPPLPCDVVCPSSLPYAVYTMFFHHLF